MIVGVKRVEIDVSNLPEALSFLTAKAGLPVTREIGSRVADTTWELGRRDDGAVLAIVDRKHLLPPVAGRITVMLESDDIASDYESLKGRGIIFEVPPTSVQWVGTVAYFTGPDGVLFGLFQPTD